jgi:hypothetical protein
MAAKHYAIFNGANQCINVVLVDDPLPAKYWPGYGAFMLCLDGTPDLSAGSGIPVISVTPSQRPQIGDVIIPGSGTVFRYAPQQIQQLDQQGNPITVSSAPQVVLKKDVEPSR